MQAEWGLSIVVPICKGKGDIRKSSCYEAEKTLTHGMKVVEWVLEKRLRIIVFVDEMRSSFMPERGTIDTKLILRKMQEARHTK